MNIIVRGNYAIAGNITYRTESPVVEIALPADGTAEVFLTIDLPHRSVEASGKYVISEDFLNLLRQEDPPKELQKPIDEEASRIRRHITSAVRRVLYAVKYCLKQVDLDENLFAIKSIVYSLDDTSWKFFPGFKVSATFSAYGSTPLDSETARLILGHLNSGVETFFCSKLSAPSKEGEPSKIQMDRRHDSS
jgi:hypothetical protein